MEAEPLQGLADLDHAVDLRDLYLVLNLEVVQAAHEVQAREGGGAREPFELSIVCDVERVVERVGSHARAGSVVASDAKRLPLFL